jgi:hypothetical protein
MVHPAVRYLRYLPDIQVFPTPREYMPATHSASPSRNIAAPALHAHTIGQSSYRLVPPTDNPSPPPSPPQDFTPYCIGGLHIEPQPQPQSQRIPLSLAKRQLLSLAPLYARNQSHLHRKQPGRNFARRFFPRAAPAPLYSRYTSMHVCMHAWVIGLGDHDELMRTSGLSYREPHCIVQKEIGNTDCTCPLPTAQHLLVTLAPALALAKNQRLSDLSPQIPVHQLTLLQPNDNYLYCA